MRDYHNVKKVISITIAYFDLGQGQDYVYHGTTVFKGFHKGDILTLSAKQRALYDKLHVSQIYPEYWIIKAGLFDEDKVNDLLDEWIYFLKTGHVLESFTAAGIPEAKKPLDKMRLSPEERKEYEAFVERQRRISSREKTAMEDIKDALKQQAEEAEKAMKQQAEEAEKAMKQQAVTTGRELKRLGVSTEIIQQATGLSIEQIDQL